MLSHLQITQPSCADLQAGGHWTELDKVRNLGAICLERESRAADAVCHPKTSILNIDKLTALSGG